MLSARELEVLSLISREQTSEEIAATLFISKKTVDNHRANILEKTGCKSTVGLVKWAIKNGLE
jgi:DNA-binding CsgD family transcriptional regulator